MLRLCLVLALLAGGASLYFGQMVVKPKLEELSTNLADTTGKLDTAQKDKAKADKESKEAKASADKAIKELSDTKTALDTKVAEAAEQRTRAEELFSKLETNTKDLTEARRELGRWQVLGIQPNQIEDIKKSLRDAEAQRDSERVANTALNKLFAQAQKELETFKNPDGEVKLPAGLKGTVTAVAAANDFVILDIGSAKGVIKGGKLMVRRGSQLITKVRIVTVQENQCIANVLPEWTQGGLAIKASDEVLY